VNRVDRDGANPAQLLIEQPTEFELALRRLKRWGEPLLRVTRLPVAALFGGAERDDGTSALLGRALGWCVRRKNDPGVAGFFPDRDHRRGKIRLGKSADGDGDIARKALTLPVDRGAAGRAEVEGEHIATLGRARPGSGLAGDGDLLAVKPRLIADHGTGAALALQAMAHGDARGLTLDGERELAAAAGGLAHAMMAPVPRCAHYSAKWGRVPIDHRLNAWWRRVWWHPPRERQPWDLGTE
jgi:hypothetical protein